MGLYTVAQELGHECEDLVRRVYARLGKTRHRAATVRKDKRAAPRALSARAAGPKAGEAAVRSTAGWFGRRA